MLRYFGNPLLRAVLLVASAWWVAAVVWDFARTPGWWSWFWSPGTPAALLSYTTRSFFMWVLGLVFGVVAVAYLVLFRRRWQKARLAGDRLRGIGTSLGPLPLSLAEPPRARAPVDISAECPEARAVVAELGRLRQTFPQHADLVVAGLRVLSLRPDLPASHVPGAHGGATLLNHSVRVAGIALGMSASYRAEGWPERRLPARDPAWQHDRADPLMLPIALLHDIGKLDAYRFDERGRVVGSAAEHDGMGARLLARMPEAWALPPQEREILLAVVAHYHRPSSLPVDVSIDGRGRRSYAIRSDRTVALLRILIQADKAAGRVEAGRDVDVRAGASEGEHVEGSSQSPEEAVSDERLLQAVVAVLLAEGAIVGGTTKAAPVGQKTSWRPARTNYASDEEWQEACAQQQGEPLVYVMEARLRERLARALSLVPADLRRRGDGRYLLSQRVLALLDATGVLVKKWRGDEFSAGNAMFVVSWRNWRTDEQIAEWKAVFVLRPVGPLAPLAQIEDHVSLPTIVRPIGGAHSARNKAGAAAAATPAADDAADYVAPADMDDVAEEPEATNEDTDGQTGAASTPRTLSYNEVVAGRGRAFAKAIDHKQTEELARRFDSDSQDALARIKEAAARRKGKQKPPAD